MTSRFERGRTTYELSIMQRFAIGAVAGSKLLAIMLGRGDADATPNQSAKTESSTTQTTNAVTLYDFETDDNRTFTVRAHGSDWVIETSGEQTATIEEGSTLYETAMSEVQVIQPNQMNIPDMSPEVMSEVFGEFAGLENPDEVQSGQVVDLPMVISVKPQH